MSVADLHSHRPSSVLPVAPPPRPPADLPDDPPLRPLRPHACLATAGDMLSIVSIGRRLACTMTVTFCLGQRRAGLVFESPRHRNRYTVVQTTSTQRDTPPAVRRPAAGVHCPRRRRADQAPASPARWAGRVRRARAASSVWGCCADGCSWHEIDTVPLAL
jgi:hypothetical protein